jgi:hypothetical protein
MSNMTKPEGAGAGSRQVKALVDAGTADAFKAACAKAGVSMAGELSRFMSEYSKTAKKPKLPSEDVSTRRNRRRRVAAIIGQMERIRDAEQGYCENFPENLRTSAPYESSEESVSVMDEVIGLLEAIYE